MKTISGHERPGRHPTDRTAAPDDGYFPRATSVLRRVHDERAIGLLYGQRALCIGALAPLDYVGTSLHTTAKTTPFKRLAHTATWFEAVMFGSRDGCDRRSRELAERAARANRQRRWYRIKPI